jgi:hypothetical protein
MRIAAAQSRHNGGVDDTQPLNSQHAQALVDNGGGICRVTRDSGMSESSVRIKHNELSFALQASRMYRVSCSPPATPILAVPTG